MTGLKAGPTRVLRPGALLATLRCDRAGRKPGRSGAPRKTIIFTPDLGGTDLYDWLETGDLTAAAASMAQSLRTALNTR